MSTTRTYWLLFTLAALSFLPTLGFYYVGEEAIHPIVAMEMKQHGQWLFQSLYGMDIQHIPLYNWLILIPSDIVGWKYMLVVARAITISATILTAVMVGWFAHRAFRDREFALFAAAAYLTLADVLLYRGWLAYVDPLFALFVFSAIAFLVVAVLERNYRWLVMAGAAITLGFMSRTLTAYVFYGASVFVLLWDREQRRFLLGIPSLLIHASVLAFPLLWVSFIDHAGHGNRMFGEILAKLSPLGFLPYLEQVAQFPLESLLRLSPLVPLAIYLLLRKRLQLEEAHPALFRALAWISLLNYLPYWLSPQSSIRYILPLFPLFALLAARVVWRSGDKALVLARNWIAAVLVLKFVLALFAFPYYQDHYRGKNYLEAADDIETLARGYPLYTTDVSASGLSVTAYLDQSRYPAPALQWPPAEWQSGYVLARSPDDRVGTIYKRYQLGGDELYLLCRGSACADKPPASQPG